MNTSLKSKIDFLSENYPGNVVQKQQYVYIKSDLSYGSLVYSSIFLCLTIYTFLISAPLEVKSLLLAFTLFCYALDVARMKLLIIDYNAQCVVRVTSFLFLFPIATDKLKLSVLQDATPKTSDPASHKFRYYKIVAQHFRKEVTLLTYSKNQKAHEVSELLNFLARP